MKLMKKLLVGLLIAVLLTVGAFAAEKISILVVGNSITSHSPNASLGWTGNWGMAATKAENDYYHQMQKLLSEEYPDVEATWTLSGIYAFEKSVGISTTTNYTQYFEASFGKTMRECMPDIVTFQMGDNISSCTKESYAEALRQLVDYCHGINPDMVVILSEYFYGSSGDAKCVAVREVAKEKGVPFVKLHKYNAPEFKPGDEFENDGVKGHPGDKGMAKIAEEFYGEISKIIAKKLGGGDVSVMVDGDFVGFDVPPTILDGRTLVPARGVFEAMGAEVIWDQATKTATFNLGADSVSVTLNSNIMKKNGADITLEVPATIIDGRTLVPVRAISEAFDAQVNWLNALKEVQVWSNTATGESPYVEMEGAIVTFADADNGFGNYAFSGGSVDEVQIVDNPQKAGDKVYFLEVSTPVAQKSWVYLWCDATGKVKPGTSYYISYDIMLGESAGGYKRDGSASLNFRYADVGGSVIDHSTSAKGGSGHVQLKKDTWTHVNVIYTVSENLDENQQVVFGVFANPIRDSKDGESGQSFYIDNITIVPYTGVLEDGVHESVPDAPVLQKKS